MTQPMREIYACLIELLDVCMKELRKSNKVPALPCCSLLDLLT